MKKRVTTLQQSIDVIRRLSEQIRCKSTPIADLLSREAVVFSPIPDQIHDDPREQWKRTLSQNAEKWGLLEDDTAILNRFLEQIGQFDTAGEVRLCEEYQTVLSEQLVQAKERVSVKGNLYITLGGGFSFLAVVLLW